MPRSADANASDEAEDRLESRLPAAEPALRRFLAASGVPRRLQDDVVQEAFARTWRSRAGFDPQRPLEPWLFATALRAWLDLRARERRRGPADAADASDPVDRASGAEHAGVDARLDLAALLGRLPRRERALVERFHRDGASLAELAAEFDMPLNTVKSHLHRARRRLAAGGER